jgi:hypothetical protein
VPRIVGIFLVGVQDYLLLFLLCSSGGWGISGCSIQVKDCGRHTCSRLGAQPLHVYTFQSPSSCHESHHVLLLLAQLSSFRLDAAGTSTLRRSLPPHASTERSVQNPKPSIANNGQYNLPQHTRGDSSKLLRPSYPESADAASSTGRTWQTKRDVTHHQTTRSLCEPRSL